MTVPPTTPENRPILTAPSGTPEVSQGAVPDANIRHRYFSAVWIIPFVAALVVIYLAVRSYVDHGPMITLTLQNAQGLSAGQTTVRYKSVVLGTVEDIELKKDLTGVKLHIRMNANTDDLLTDHARFWIVRPHLMTLSISEIVSGTYIEVDPGASGGQKATHFVGVENMADAPTTDPGTSYILQSKELGSLNSGSPVFYRDIEVGEVMGYDMGNGYDPIKIKVFVKSPYDQFIKAQTHFWNASGVSVKVGAGGLHVELQSLQSVLAGGIAFSTPVDAANDAQADAKTVFPLYENQKTADAAAYTKHVPYITYLQTSIKDLAVGSPVQIFGIQVGEVTDVKLSFNALTNEAKVRVAFEIEPERAFGPLLGAQSTDAMQKLVQSGMRVKMESTDLLTGHQALSLQFVPKSEPATAAAVADEINMEGDAMVLPGQAGGIDSLTSAVGDIAAKLNQIPFEEIGRNLDHLLASANDTFAGPEMKQTVHALSVTMANAQDISQSAHDNLTPALQRLPEISAQLQSAVTHANEFAASLNNGFGQDSDFARSAKHVLDEVNDAARSIRLLSDYIDRHPEALLSGKSSGKSDEKAKP